MFYTGKKSEKEYLAPKHLIKHVLTPDTEELMHRLGYGVSETAAMLDLIPWLQKSGGEKDSTAMLQLFADRDDMPKAISYLNLGDENKCSSAASSEHLQTVVEFFGTDTAAKQRLTRKVMMWSARLFLASAAAHKFLALLTHNEMWADKVQDQSKQSAAVKAWLKKPANVEKLVAAMTAELNAHPKGGKAKAKRNTLSNSSGSAASGYTYTHIIRHTRLCTYVYVYIMYIYIYIYTYTHVHR